jgi:hypothetical protein
MKKFLLLAPALLLAVPALAQAHDATIACDLANPGQYVVTPDYLHLDPVTTFEPSRAVVTWSDGYVVRLPYPQNCPVPPPPPWTPQPPLEPGSPEALPVVPEPVIPVPVVGPAPRIEPMPRVRTCRELLAKPRAGRRTLIRLGCVTPKTRKITCRWLLKHRAGKLSYTRRGFYYRCRAPKPTPRKHYPVTG